MVGRLTRCYPATLLIFDAEMAPNVNVETVSVDE